ncbi:hypothetical protein [Methylobacterium sp. NEAU K]|uniref:hypothetical protein n=1 Tax=Methylobacterium sp. NEAU K TaxID=3064946 RepID=UPI002733CA9A|nr:hypothetical protein [Methylobacterium sp. NEAU K]MDP4003222.1 hypothetical protein [Methylobacterium sp. NEAU K]
MRRQDQLALKDTATGRVSMPFLPTMAVVAILGIASLYCSSKPSPPEVRAELHAPAAPTSTDFAPADFAVVAPIPAPTRRPASLAFSDVYPLAVPSPAEAATTPPRPAMAVRATSHVAVAGRHACPGRRCPDTPQPAADPLAAARSEVSEPDADNLPPLALPFAASVAERLAPAARVVVDAADLVRDGAAAVQGSVALAVVDCLR